MDDVVKAMKALSDETRLRILNVLLERECCVCEVMQALDISQTRASRNLGILHDAGFLKMRKEGLWALYSIDRDGMEEILLLSSRQCGNRWKATRWLPWTESGSRPQSGSGQGASRHALDRAPLFSVNSLR